MHNNDYFGIRGDCKPVYNTKDATMRTMIYFGVRDDCKPVYNTIDATMRTKIYFDIRGDCKPVYKRPPTPQARYIPCAYLWTFRNTNISSLSTSKTPPECAANPFIHNKNKGTQNRPFTARSKYWPMRYFSETRWNLYSACAAACTESRVV